MNPTVFSMDDTPEFGRGPYRETIWFFRSMCLRNASIIYARHVAISVIAAKLVGIFRLYSLMSFQEDHSSGANYFHLSKIS